MSEQLKIITVTIASAGTRQRCVTDALSHDRYPGWAHFKAREINSGDCYLGDSTVSSTVYSEVLHAADHGGVDWEGGTERASGARDQVDLYETWIDAASSGDKVFITIGKAST